MLQGADELPLPRRSELLLGPPPPALFSLLVLLDRLDRELHRSRYASSFALEQRHRNCSPVQRLAVKGETSRCVHGPESSTPRRLLSGLSADDPRRQPDPLAALVELSLPRDDPAMSQRSTRRAARGDSSSDQSHLADRPASTSLRRNKEHSPDADSDTDRDDDEQASSRRARDVEQGGGGGGRRWAMQSLPAARPGGAGQDPEPLVRASKKTSSSQVRPLPLSLLSYRD